MKIFIEDQILEYENNREKIDNILTEIDNIIGKTAKTLSHMIIDGNEVISDFNDYFLDNINNINKVEVVALTYKELVDDILNSTLDYLERTPELIEGLANTFYKEPTKESWQDINDLFGGIGWIINTFTSIDKDHRLKSIVLSYEDWNLYAKEVFSLVEILENLEEALSNNDYVSIADILSYEIGSTFTEMGDKLSSLVHREADSYDLN